MMVSTLYTTGCRMVSFITKVSVFVMTDEIYCTDWTSFFLTFRSFLIVWNSLSTLSILFST